MNNNHNDDNPYTRNGYKDREDYLSQLSEQYGEAVYDLSDALGPGEDFDGLISALEDADFLGLTW